MLQHPHPPTAIPFPSFPSSHRPHFHCHISSNATHPTTHLAATATSSSASASPSASGAGGGAATDAELLALLRSGDTDAAYALFSSTPQLPSPTCLSRLLAQLSYQKHSPTSFPRALALLRRLRAAGELRRLDSNSLSLAVSAASRSGHAPLASSLLLSMLRHGHLPDARAYTTTISRLSDPAASLRLFAAVLRHLRRLGGAAAASSALPDTAAFNAALNAAADLGDARRFRGLFDDMPYWKIKPDALSYNIVIKMCARAGRRDLVARALEQIILSDLTPCVTTMHSLVAAYVGFDDLETAEKIVQAMREQRKDLCLILREAKNGNAGGALEDSVVLEEIFGKSAAADGEPPLLPKTYVPDSRIYTTLMKGYMKAGRVEDVVRTVRAMRREGESDPASRPDHVTYTTVVSAYAGAGEMDRARAVLDEMAWAGVPANRVTYNVLLKGYCRQLQMDRAKELVREMPGTGIEPDVVSYNILIDGCVLVDDSAGALAYFNEMRTRGIAPSGVSYTTLMKAFALSGQAKLARKVFDEMDKDPRVKVDRVAWNMLVEGYCRLGLIEEAKKIVERMKERGAQPDVATYGSLANGISLARRPGEALLLWNEVKERCQGRPPLRPDEGLLDTLADVCVRAAFFKKALEIVACMEEHGIAPNKTKYKKIYIEMHSRMFTSKHASQARQDRRKERKRAAEAFKFWLGLPNEYYGSEWRLEPLVEDGYELS